MSSYQDERTFKDGEIVVAEGDTGTEMFVIQQGRVSVTKAMEGGELHLATLERGDFFGEMSLLESLPRSATVRAVGETRVLAIRSGELLMKIRRDPTFAFEMLQNMSRRIRFLDEQIVKAMEARGAGPDAARIVSEGEFTPRR